MTAARKRPQVGREVGLVGQLDEQVAESRDQDRQEAERELGVAAPGGDFHPVAPGAPGVVVAPFAGMVVVVVAVVVVVVVLDESRCLTPARSSFT